jgi:two-component system sensor histidine kinase HydH
MNQKPFEKDHALAQLRRLPMLGICFAFLMVVVVCVAGLWNDLQRQQQLILASEIANLQSHVERTIVRIESDLRQGKSLEQFSAPNVTDWLVDHWTRMIASKPERLYAAIEDSSGSVLAFSSKTDLSILTNGNSVAIDGFPRSIRRVSLGQGPNLTTAVEVGLPVELNNLRIATYRSAIPGQWLENRIRASTRNRWLVWLSILFAMSVIVSTTALFLFRLGTNTQQLEQALKTSETRRLADLSKLVVSMAHELRNPLNSIRLNLFTSEKLIRGDSPIDQEEALVMIQESVSEIERVNELIGQLLGFVKADENQETWLNLDAEIQSILHFMKSTHELHHIRIDYRFEEQNAIGNVSTKYFRQILINLLQNARQAMPEGGLIHLHLHTSSQSVILAIEDSGPGVASNLFEKIFEPFYSTRHDGAGLGLAVVKNLIEATGGSISCQRSSRLGGMRFTLRFQSKHQAVSILEAKS